MPPVSVDGEERNGALGKTEEFEELYSESRDRLAGQLYTLTGDAHGAYDLVQEAFVRTWMRWDRIAGYDDREAFVRRVAFNLAKSNFRKLRRAVLRSSPPDAVSGPDSSARDEPVAGLRTLSEKEREAIVLRYIAGLTVDEVAARWEPRPAPSSRGCRTGSRPLGPTPRD